MKINKTMAIWINSEFLDEGKGKKTAARDLISPEKKIETPKEPKQIGNGKNDIIERAEQKVITEDGRELLK